MIRRCLYLNDFVDEIMPCDPTPEGWATWLSEPDPDWDRLEATPTATEFDGHEVTYRYISYILRGTAIHWYEPLPESWSTAAPAFGHGLGWNPDDIAIDMEELRAAILDGDDGTPGVAAFAIRERAGRWRYTTFPSPRLYEVFFAANPVEGGGGGSALPAGEAP